MRHRGTGIRTAVTTLLLLGASPAAAQYNPLDIDPGPRRVDLSGSGGFMLSTDWSNLVVLGSVSSVTGAFQQVLSRDLVVDPGPVFDGVVTYWEGRYGVRVHGGYSRSCLATGSSCGATLGGAASTIDVDSWIYDLGGAIGLIDYRRSAKVWPYVFLGLGGVTYRMDRTVGPPLTIIERRPPSNDAALIVSHTDPDQLLISLEELGTETQFAWNLGLGTDFRIPVAGGSIGVRVEVSDHMHRSPVSIDIANLEGFTPAGDTSVDFGVVHNLRAAVGFVVQFGK